MAVTVAELTVAIDTTQADEAMDRLALRLGELRAEAEAIRKALPGTKAEVDAVLEAMERMIDVQPKPIITQLTTWGVESTTGEPVDFDGDPED